MNHWVGGWRHDLENQAEILSRSMCNYARWQQSLLEYDWEPPEELDPRGDWNPVENQGPIGSCQGQSLADAADYCYMLSHGEQIQLSRSWAYLLSQKFDGINGDRGSTLDGGSKAAMQVGLVEEKDCPYQGSYNSMRSFFNSNYDRLVEKAQDFKLQTEVPLATYDEIYHFLAGQTGPVQIGILWGLPDAWEIRSYRASGGGHAVLFVGYLKVSGWPKPGLLLKNSWGKSWGRDGYAIVHPDAVEGMCRHRWNVFVGRSDMDSPRPRPKPDL